MARFIRRGVSKMRFAAAIVDPQSVTRAEITSSTDLTPKVASVTGFMLEGSQVPTPDFGSDFDSSIPGIDSAPASSFGFYEDDDDDTIEVLLPKDTEGWVLLFRKGDVPASDSLDVFPVKVGSRGTQWSAGNEPAQFSINFNITDKPALDTTIPALT